jgi:Holliday junction resolvase RusA-like endonuclease
MELTVWAKPEPQRRARHTVKGNIHRTYPHPRDAKYRAFIREAYIAEYGEEVMFQKGVVLAANLIAHVPCPASISGLARRQGRAGWPQGRDGDLDNIEKAVWDALQGFAFWNDKQVVMHREPYMVLFAFNQATGADTSPHLWIRLEEL